MSTTNTPVAPASRRPMTPVEGKAAIAWTNADVFLLDTFLPMVKNATSCHHGTVFLSFPHPKQILQVPNSSENDQQGTSSGTLALAAGHLACSGKMHPNICRFENII